MRKAATAVLAACAFALTGCAGIPGTQAPEPTSSYPTFSAGDSASDECKTAVDRVNALSKTMTQITEALERGDILQLVGLTDQLSTQANELGEGLSGDAHLQEQVEGIQSSIKAVTDELQQADAADPNALLATLQTEGAAIQQHVTEIGAYCSS